MEKEILLYGDINSYTAIEFINAMNSFADNDIAVRMATDGGDPEYGFGIIAKFAEHLKGKCIYVDGKAYSFGAFMCTYADDVVCLNVSRFLFHRAAYPKWFEADPNFFTEAIRQNLKTVNDNLKQALVNKIDVEKFEKITKVTIEELFSMDDRKDVFLSASDAKKIGLVSEVVNITPKKKAEIEAIHVKMAAKYNPTAQQELDIKNPIKMEMTLKEFKAAHPEIFAQAVNEGVLQERDRVGSWLPYLAADAELVTNSIKKGDAISATAMSELNVKMFAASSVDALAKGNAKPVVTSEIDMNKTQEVIEAEAKQKTITDFRNEARAQLNLKPIN